MGSTTTHQGCSCPSCLSLPPQARGWGGAVRRGLTREEEAEMSKGQRRPCLPIPAPYTPSPDTRRPAAPHPQLARARGRPCQAEGTQGPGVARAKAKGPTEPSPQEAGLGGFLLRLRMNSPMVKPASSLGNLLAPPPMVQMKKPRPTQVGHN